MEQNNNQGTRQHALIDMLSSPDKWMNRSQNFLTLLMRRVMYDIGLVPRQYLAYIERWLQRKFGVSKETATKIATHRNNFISEVSQDNVTVGTFLKFTESLGASKIVLTARFEFDDGRGPVESTISFTNSMGSVDVETVERRVKERMERTKNH